MFVRHWTITHASLLLIFGAVVCFFLSSPKLLLVVGVISFLTFIYAHKSLLAEYQPWGGWANWVTFVRLLILLFAVAGYTQLGDAVFGGILIGILVLDGMDGYLARKFQQMSEFGAQLDMEVDAFYCALISSLLFLEKDFGAWILVAGYLRYFFVWILATGGLDRVEKEIHVPGAKWYAVLFFIGLLSPFLIPVFAAQLLIFIGIGLVFFSFGYELYLRAR